MSTRWWAVWKRITYLLDYLFPVLSFCRTQIAQQSRQINLRNILYSLTITQNYASKIWPVLCANINWRKSNCEYVRHVRVWRAANNLTKWDNKRRWFGNIWMIYTLDGKIHNGNCVDKRATWMYLTPRKDITTASNEFIMKWEIYFEHPSHLVLRSFTFKQTLI